MAGHRIKTRTKEALNSVTQGLLSFGKSEGQVPSTPGLSWCQLAADFMYLCCGLAESKFKLCQSKAILFCEVGEAMAGVL